jgi:hypothetical protein
MCAWALELRSASALAGLCHELGQKVELGLLMIKPW